jgi:hypothetical protein
MVVLAVIINYYFQCGRSSLQLACRSTYPVCAVIYLDLLIFILFYLNMWIVIS